MATGSDSKKARLKRLLEERGVTHVDEALFAELREVLSPVSDSYLRQMLRASGLTLHPLVEGVSLHSPEDLRRTLRSFAGLYGAAVDRARKDQLRSHVIEMKSRLRTLLARTTEDELRTAREAMAAEMLVWLENPNVYELWVDLRIRRETA